MTQIATRIGLILAAPIRWLRIRQRRIFIAQFSGKPAEIERAIYGDNIAFGIEAKE